MNEKTISLDELNPLIRQIHDADREGTLSREFTARDVRNWMEDYKIRKGDGTKYAQSYSPSSLLSRSYIRAKDNTSTNIRCLDRRKDGDSPFIYWFAPSDQWRRKGEKRN